MNSAVDEWLKEIRTFAKTYIWLSPLNIAEEKEKFFKSKTYSPKLIYPTIPVNILKRHKSLLRKIKYRKGSTYKDWVFNERLKETRLRNRFISSIGNAKAITLSSEKLYKLKFNKRYIESAKKDALIPLSFKTKSALSTKDIAKAMNKYLKRYDADDWKVTITNQRDYYVQIKASKKLILISKFVDWDFSTLDSTLAHEIDGHVVRAINASSQKDIFSKRFPFYIKTEEGLASFLGDYCADGGKLSLKHHAIKYLGGYIALNTSFRETYNFFLDYRFPKNLAFQKTLRLKRGLTDTKLPGCNAREAMYYEGFLEVKKYIKNGGSIKRLFAGKAGLTDVPSMPIPKNIIIPDRIAKYMKSKTVKLESKPLSTTPSAL